ncbi:efflux transporter, RND family, MFP subunit [Chloroherpeton thalassium ATCC 35110]|uniref:Efflux transporter, RND family, MFP subunit n=1 Tax=Chloroherpeton thalassium (strain ATCC 35110 / GB-78) TaxID=517418 RepID=B3QU90_CHLT3|nr:efflux RND transporter periplasmic adaptor subunit [Chloroherpeton thalassium]ACF14339.1 efflux transporter, RND family, MFP subunit [Chloroherpeton thalassium ATCC 35110]
MQTAKKIVPKLTIGVGILFFLSIGYILLRGNIVKVEVEKVDEGELIQAIYATGFIDADGIANLRSEVAGTVSFVGAKEGEAVQRGQTILAFKERDFQLALEITEAQLSEQQILLADRKRNLERTKNLFRAGAVSEQQFDDTKKQFDQAKEILLQRELAIKRAKEDLAKTKMVAPLNGILTYQNAKLGDYIVLNSLVATIVDTSTYNVALEVDELDVPRLQLGQEAIVALDAIPDDRFKARVVRTVPQTDLVTKTSKVYLKLTQNVPSIQVGMTATANIIYNVKPNTILVKKAATLMEKKERFVWKISENKLVKQPIQTGAGDLKSIEVLAGLNKGDLIVTNPKETFKEGMETEIVETAATE